MPVVTQVWHEAATGSSSGQALRSLSDHTEMRAFLNCQLVPRLGNAWDHTFEPGKFPRVEWGRPVVVEKVMGIVSGKSIFRLMRENLFDPLGMSHTTLEEDLGFSCFSTAADFAKIGQLLLNQGAYGDLAFFSPKTFEQLLPQPLSRYYPGLDKERGIGITRMRQPHPDAGKNGVPADATFLSRNTIGRGSATAAILRVDLDHELVISQTRRRAGSDYDKHLLDFLIALEDGLQ
jgi:CubicO group peptidase (beta-lactamase class C family)